MLLSILIPCFNEEKYISLLLEKVEKVKLKIDKEIIIIDDGSSDNTVSIIKKNYPNLKLIELKENKGKGNAIIEGLKHINGDIVIIQDADLEYDPFDYINLIDSYINNNAKVVYGSRILNKKNGKSSELYYLGGRLLTLITNTIFNSKITDEATGYKLFNAELLKSLNIKSQGFEFCPEVTAKILKRKIKIYEVPINYYPRSRSEGKKIKAVRDGLKAVLTLMKYRFTD